MSCGGGGGGILAAASAAGAPLSPVALLVARARFREDERGGARIAVGILLRCWTLREIVLFRDCFRWEGNYVKCQYSETGGNMEEDGIVSKDAWLSLSNIGRSGTEDNLADLAAVKVQ